LTCTFETRSPNADLHRQLGDLIDIAGERGGGLGVGFDRHELGQRGQRGEHRLGVGPFEHPVDAVFALG